MAIPLRQSTASQEVPIGYFVDSTDGNTEETGLTIANTDVKIWKAGATTLANKNSGGATHISNGIYYLVLDATDTNTLGPLVAFVHVTGALPVRLECVVLAANVYDALIAASDALQVDTIQLSGTTQTARDIGASVLLSPGTGTGQISLASGAVTAGTVSDKTGYSLTATTGLGNQTANITGNLSGSVGSVTAGVALAATATSAQLVDDVWDEVLNAAAHNVANSAGRRLRQLQDLGTYALAAAWVDTVNGTSTGTTDFEDATVTNRSTTFNNAQTVAASVGLSRIFPTNGNSVTLTQTINNFEIGIPGGNWTLALGGQDIGGCDINDAIVSGIATGTDPHFHRCFIGASTLPPSELFNCGIGNASGTLTVGSAGDYKFIDCYSDVPGSSAPVVDLGAAVGASTMEFRRWSGGLTLNNVAAGDVISVDVVSGGTITVNGTGGTVVIRGMCNVVDGSSGSVSITETSVVNMTKINAEVDSALDTAIPGVPTAGSINDVLSDLSALLPTSGTLLNDTDTFAEPSSIPAATATLPAKIGLITALARNKVTQTATTQTLRNDADSANIGTASVSDDGTTFTKGKLA